MTLSNEQNDRIASIRRRIANIRAILESPDFMIETSAGGISERIDRNALNSELRDLEFEESNLTGSNQRFTSINLTHC